jgi:hypothetical protein
MDALDNLYVLISGHKTFRLVPPHLAPALHTISPTYAVLNNGFSLQYSFQTALSEEQRETLLSSSVEGDEPSMVHKLVHGESLEYDSNSIKFYHFSSINDLKVSLGSPHTSALCLISAIDYFRNSEPGR